MAEKVETGQQQESVADSKVPTGVRMLFSCKQRLKKTRRIQPMPKHDAKERRADRKEHRGDGDSSMQFIHAANPLVKAADPQENRRKLAEHQAHTPAERPLLDRVEEYNIGEGRNDRGHKQPAVDIPIHAP